jgi:uncharacterized protein YeaO (DUF488 family)
MSIRVVRLGSQRQPGEGVRLGTVRRPPRGVPKSEFAKQNWFDVWLPNLAPSAELMGWIHSVEPSDADWRRFRQRYRKEMAGPDAAHLLATLAALSSEADFSVGCYCEDESRCHRSLLRELLREAGAEVR